MKHLPNNFHNKVDRLARDYLASIPFDQRLYRQDIEGSIAHVKMLAKQGIIANSDAEVIIKGLSSIREEIEQGKFLFKRELEDIHMNVEARLFEKIGDVAGKLHTARSRNDQIALDLRLFAKEEILKTIDSEGINLVIMGTHGRKGLDHTIFGSVAENVMKKSPVPVLVINPYKMR